MVCGLHLPLPCLSGEVEGKNLYACGSEFPSAAGDRLIMKMKNTGIW